MNNNEEIKAPTSGRFCAAMALAKQFALDGYWSGSSYQYHPCGVVRRGIIFKSKWNRNNYCTADVILDPTSLLVQGCQDPRANGDPEIRPARGGLLRVYSDGHWVGDDGPWRMMISHEINEIERSAEIHRAAVENRVALGKARAAAEYAVKVEQARAALARYEETSCD